MTTLAQALSSALLQFVWQGLLVSCLLWVSLSLLRKQTAAVRYVLSSVALAIMAVLPVATTWWIDRAGPAVPMRFTVTLDQIPSAAISVSWLAWIHALALPLWSIGVVIFTARLAWGARYVHLIRRKATAADEPIALRIERLAARIGVARPVRVLMTTLADGPTVVGWIRPAILLPPAALAGLSIEQLEAVIAHELAHVRRCDYLINIAQMIVETLLFYHPAVWWVSARIRHERELCCDDIAVAACGDAIGYARALAILERMRIAQPGFAMAATGGPLLFRVQRLMGAIPRQSGPSRTAGAVALCLALLGIGLNFHQARARAQEQAILVPQAPEWAARDRERGLQVSTAKAALVRRTPVEYPSIAIAKGVRGSVTVGATLNSDGSVTDARVISGPAELRKSSLQSVLQWRFTPAAEGSMAQVTIDFRNPPARTEPNSQFNFTFVRQGVPEMRERVAERERALQEVREQAAKHPGEPVWQRRIAEREAALADARRGLQHAVASTETASLLDKPE